MKYAGSFIFMSIVYQDLLSADNTSTHID